MLRSNFSFIQTDLASMEGEIKAPIKKKASLSKSIPPKVPPPPKKK